MHLGKYKIGMRTIKTGIAVSLSMFLASLIDLKSPIFVGIGAIMAMQSTVSESFVTGTNRMRGTFVGASVGLLLSYILPQNYIFLGLGIIIVIHIHYIFNWKKSLSLSAIVFLAIFLNTESARIPYAINRLLDTFIGIGVAVLVNYFIAAPDSEKSFIQAIKHLYLISKSTVYNLVRGKTDVNLVDIKTEISAIEDTYNLLKQEIEMNISKSKINESSNNILIMLDEIYNDISTIAKIDKTPMLSDNNIKLFEELYSINFIDEHTEELQSLDIVYNYHLEKIFINLLEIQITLKK